MTTISGSGMPFDFDGEGWEDFEQLTVARKWRIQKVFTMLPNMAECFNCGKVSSDNLKVRMRGSEFQFIMRCPKCRRVRLGGFGGKW